MYRNECVNLTLETQEKNSYTKNSTDIDTCTIPITDPFWFFFNWLWSNIQYNEFGGQAREHKKLTNAMTCGRYVGRKELWVKMTCSELWHSMRPTPWPTVTLSRGSLTAADYTNSMLVSFHFSVYKSSHGNHTRTGNINPPESLLNVGVTYQLNLSKITTENVPQMLCIIIYVHTCIYTYKCNMV